LPEGSNPADLLLVLVHAKTVDDVSRLIQLSHIWKRFHESGHFPMRIDPSFALHLWPEAAMLELQAEKRGNGVSVESAQPSSQHQSSSSSSAQYQTSSSTLLAPRTSSSSFSSSELGTAAIGFDEVRKPESESFASLFKPPSAESRTVFQPTAIDHNRQLAGLTWQSEYATLFMRHFREYIRSPFVIRLRIFQALFVSLLVGLVYLQIGNTQASIQSRNGSLFFLATNQVFSCVSAVQLTFSAERPIFERDLRAGAYRIWTYFFATSILEFPIQGLVVWLISVIVYWMVGYSNQGTAYWQFLLTLVLFSFGAVSLGFIIAAGTRTQEASLIITPIVLIPMLIFGGFFINSNSIPTWLAWIRYISIFYYGFAALMISQYTNLTLTCTSSELIESSSGTLFCPFTSGEQVLAQLGINPDDKAFFWIMLLVLWIAYWLIALILLWIMSRPSHLVPSTKPLPPDWTDMLRYTNAFIPRSVRFLFIFIVIAVEFNSRLLISTVRFIILELIGCPNLLKS
jgi:ABC-type multidrug transport system permease subunit